MKSLCTDEEVQAIVNREREQILTLIIRLICDFLDGNLDIDQLIALLENIEDP